jgi:hypothetical protein
LKLRAIVSRAYSAGAIDFVNRAHGGSTGFSDWSDPVQHMCM